MSVNYLQEVKGDLDGPSCHVCGAIMVKTSWGSSENIVVLPKWKCLSCGTTTGCEEVEPMSNICTCNDLVNNGDHYCPVHGTFATPNWLGSNAPTAGMVTQVYQPADDTSGERFGASWSDTGTTITKPAPSADQPEWIIAAAREIHSKRLTDTLAMAHVIRKHCEKPSAAQPEKLNAFMDIHWNKPDVDGGREQWPSYLPKNGIGAVAAIMNLWIRDFVSSPSAESIREAAAIVDSLINVLAAPAPVSGEGRE